MPSPALILGLLIAWLMSLVAIGAWQNDAGTTSERQKWQQKQIAAEQNARLVERNMAKKLEEARNEQAKRESANRAALASANRAAAGLRDTIGNLRRELSSATAEACRNTADSALAVFGECSARLGALAEAADGHATDAMTCLAAWPEGK